MAIDWSLTNTAYQYSRSGDIASAIEIFSRLMKDAESDADRSAILLGKATCYSHVGDLTKSREFIEAAKQLATGQREIMLQISMSEASLRVLTKEYGLACEKFATVKDEYSDVLAEDSESAVELDLRFAAALVDARRYDDAIPLLRRLLSRTEIPDRQWLQIYLGTALASTGKEKEAQEVYFAAASGPDSNLAKTALEYASAAGATKQ
jgi:tetratricopeptide (TPR) repeat protein